VADKPLDVPPTAQAIGVTVLQAIPAALTGVFTNVYVPRPHAAIGITGFIAIAGVWIIWAMMGRQTAQKRISVVLTFAIIIGCGVWWTQSREQPEASKGAPSGSVVIQQRSDGDRSANVVGNGNQVSTGDLTNSRQTMQSNGKSAREPRGSAKGATNQK
jgi:hypothetical protein